MKWSIFSLLLTVWPALFFAQEPGAACKNNPAVAVQPDIVHFSIDTLRPGQDKIGQKRYNDSIRQAKWTARYERKLNHYRTAWERLIPSHTKIQLAGGIGVVSLGFGWDYGKHKQWETDILFGYLPKYSSDKWKITMTLKQNYIPWNIYLGKSGFSFHPLTCGLYLNTILSGDFWVTEPDRYPKGYYGFSTRIRSHIFLGERFTYNIKPGKRLAHKSISFYYELCTSDVYLISAFTNRYLTFTDIVSLAFGLKFQIF